MQKEITSNVELNPSTEKKGLSLDRIRVEQATTDNDSRILGMDYPSGILVSD
jgi:hypothetical protein